MGCHSYRDWYGWFHRRVCSGPARPQGSVPGEGAVLLQRSANRDDRLLGADEDQRPAARLRRGQWPLPIQGKTSSVDKLEFFAPLGCGSGGSTLLYSAQLERFLPSDFTPHANYPNVLDSALPEARPITYAELLPYYRRAEQLYRVRGTQDPLNPDPDSPLRESPPLSARDQDICDSFEQLGPHPYHAHVGLEYVAGCDGCMAVMCPLDCKSDAGQICLLPALEEFGAKILPECEVVSLEADRSKVTHVQCKRNGEVLFISAKVVCWQLGPGTRRSCSLNPSRSCGLTASPTAREWWGATSCCTAPTCSP